MDVQELLRYTVEKDASDLHLKAGNVPHIRVNGTLEPAPYDELSPERTEAFAAELMPERKAKEFAETSEADFSYAFEDVGRFRVNVFRQRGNVGIALRRIRTSIPTIEDLELPPVVQTLSDMQRGLILVAGPTGTGKTTSIAAMIGHINRTRRCHIITMEDPIEVVHEDELSIVDQREVGIDTLSYAEGLRRVLRQDPDVIFIGEIRDPESMIAAIQAAETGHLVISTLHTIDATETVNRVVDLFPPQQQIEGRSSFAGALEGIVCQRLVPLASGDGRIPAVEILVKTGRVFERIIDPKATFSITDVIAEGEFYGMQTFELALVKLVQAGRITEEDALKTTNHPHDFQLLLRGEMGGPRGRTD
ncbi:MAG: PilT/PilU family type 4a pilus ATPase [Actinomycetota bacterium]